MCLSADWTGAPLLLRICFHPCHTKVLICTYMFHWCLFAGKQAHYSFLHCHNLSFQLGIKCRCVCPHWTGMLIPPITLVFYLSGVCGSVPLGRASLACLGCPCFGWPVPVRFSCGFLFLALRGSSLSSLLLGVLLWLLSFCCLPLWLGACGLCPLFPVPPSLSLCLLVFSGPVSVLLVLPPDIWLYLQRSGCHTFGMACRVDWLLSSLRSLATKASALCGLCPLHHVVVLFMCPSLRR